MTREPRIAIGENEPPSDDREPTPQPGASRPWDPSTDGHAWEFTPRVRDRRGGFLRLPRLAEPIGNSLPPLDRAFGGDGRRHITVPPHLVAFEILECLEDPPTGGILVEFPTPAIDLHLENIFAPNNDPRRLRGPSTTCQPRPPAPRGGLMRIPEREGTRHGFHYGRCNATQNRRTVWGWVEARLCSRGCGDRGGVTTSPWSSRPCVCGHTGIPLFSTHDIPRQQVLGTAAFQLRARPGTNPRESGRIRPLGPISCRVLARPYRRNQTFCVP